MWKIKWSSSYPFVDSSQVSSSSFSLPLSFCSSYYSSVSPPPSNTAYHGHTLNPILSGAYNHINNHLPGLLLSDHDAGDAQLQLRTYAVVMTECTAGVANHHRIHRTRTIASILGRRCCGSSSAGSPRRCCRHRRAGRSIRHSSVVLRLVVMRSSDIRPIGYRISRWKYDWIIIILASSRWISIQNMIPIYLSTKQLYWQPPILEHSGSHWPSKFDFEETATAPAAAPSVHSDPTAEYHSPRTRAGHAIHPLSGKPLRSSSLSLGTGKIVIKIF